jgi:hypothetical protein
VAEYNPPDNPIPGYPLQVRFEKETGKWLQENRSLVMGPDGKVQFDPITGKSITELVGWRDLDFGRGTILVPGQPIMDEENKIEVTLLGRSNREIALWYDRTRFDKCDYLKIAFQGQSFFVKRSFITINPGFTEFQRTASAKKVLNGMDFVKVVEAKLGYQDKKESWFISKWENLEEAGFATLLVYSREYDDYGKKIKGVFAEYGHSEYLNQEREYRDAEQKAELIRTRLKKEGISHDIAGNLFYNPKTKTFILIDVTSESTKELGNPIRETKY